MRFSNAVSLVLASRILSATALPTDAVGSAIQVTHMGDELLQEMELPLLQGVELDSSNNLEKREPITLTTIALTAAGTWATEASLNAIVDHIKKTAHNWNEDREKTTQYTTQEMSKISGYSTDATVGRVVSEKLTKGSLSTDWDCFYVAKGGVVTIKGDGGYANLAMVHARGVCDYSKPRGQKYWRLQC
ncbi:hypothetical protein CNMCM6805_010331 [Aspergillus fumigatiaffinis]|uniref:DUF7888 domain-containing protein n=1 Tax=Aspergillus fumigatiaffinis TaxID=340414 RepID=A0A8H4GYZ5_9EURO|nr:hypothetical protein CNMCM6805_010331 [Aspergillus fumigatiaffinis]